MLKKSVLIASFLSATVSTLWALPENRGLPELAYDVPPPPSATNLWIHVGENMRYKIKWGIFNVGTTEATTRWVRHEDGRTLILIRLDSESNSVIEKIYPIRDIQESLIDPETFLPIYFYKKSQQGSRLYDELVTFDHENGKAYWENFVKDRKETIDIEKDSRDIITMMYYLRSPERQLEKENSLRVYTDEKIYEMFVTLMEREKVKLSRYGKVDTAKYEPKAQFEGLFVSKGRMFMWVSEDERRICTQLQAELPVASVRLILEDVSGPGDDFWITTVEDESDNEKGWRRR